MKTIRLVLMALGLIILSSNLMAQNPTDFFKGEWTLETSGSPSGDSKMILKLDRINGKLGGTLKIGEEKEIILSSVTEKEDSITIYFTSTSGYDVDLPLTKINENHVKGTIMGMVEVKGERKK